VTIPTYQARIFAAETAHQDRPIERNTAHLSPAGIVTVHDASGVFRAAKLSNEQLLELAEEIRVALESRKSV
jgi:hypothetical protein